MTKIRCQICGSENLHSENAVLIICDDCGNRSYVIPSEAITRLEEDCNIVTLQYDKSKTDCPRKSFCLNDKMFPDAEPCSVCNLVYKRFGELTTEMIDKYEERMEFIRQHPELEDEYKEEQDIIDRLNGVIDTGLG